MGIMLQQQEEKEERKEETGRSEWERRILGTLLASHRQGAGVHQPPTLCVLINGGNLAA